MKSLPTLIKLAKDKVFQQRGKVSALESTLNELLNQRHHIQDSLAQEAAIAKTDPFTALPFGPFSEKMHRILADLAAHEQKILQRLEQEKLTLGVLYQELKSLELYQDSCARKAAKALAHQEQQQMDDLIQRVKRL
jgi:hypothetical protein